MHRIHWNKGLRQFCRAITFTSSLVAFVSAPLISKATPQELSVQPESCESRLSHSAAVVVPSGQNAHPDKILKTLRVKGSFSKFEVGDYTHVVIKKVDGKETSFWLGSNGEVLMKFLVAHKGEPLLLTYQVVKSYIPEAGGYETIERLVEARSGGETSAQWWKRIKADSAARKKIERETQKMLESTNQ